LEQLAGTKPGPHGSVECDACGEYSCGKHGCECGMRLCKMCMDEHQHATEEDIVRPVRYVDKVRMGPIPGDSRHVRPVAVIRVKWTQEDFNQSD